MLDTGGVPGGHRRSPSLQRMLIAAGVALLCAGVISVKDWTSSPNWSNADSLFYQAMSLQVSGSTAQTARDRVFDSSLSRPAIAQQPNVADAHWRGFEAQFFLRRWVVPAMAAVIRPDAGQRALPDVAIVGYLAFAAVLAALLASRFGLIATLPAALLCLDLGPVRDWATRPMTDSWGLVFAVGAVLAALLVLRRGKPWLLAWVAMMAALSFTRDLALAPLAAVLWLGFRRPDRESRRTALIMIVSGAIVTIPAYVLFGAPLRLTLASVIDNFRDPTPAHATWSYVAHHYLSFTATTIKADVSYAIHHPFVGLTLVVGLIPLFVLTSRRDPLILMMRGWALGWPILFLVNPVYSGFRYEIAILPAAAVGICMLIEDLTTRVRRQRAAVSPRRHASSTPRGLVPTTAGCLASTCSHRSTPR
jgi:hypothetical protein